MRKIMSLQWHINGLKNTKRWLRDRQEDFGARKKIIDRIKNNVALTEYQIASAKKEGKDGFDSERYKIKEKDTVCSEAGQISGKPLFTFRLKNEKKINNILQKEGAK